MKFRLPTDISEEAKKMLSGDWPKIPVMDFDDTETVNAIKQGADDFYKQVQSGSENGCVFEDTLINGVPCCWITPKIVTSEDVIYYIHGGGGIFCSPRSNYAIATQMASEIGCRVLSVDYPKSPEHQYPEPQNAIEKAYKSFLDMEFKGDIFLLADSFGSSLAVNLILRCKKGLLRIPDKVVLVCPFIDFLFEGDSYKVNHLCDPSFDDIEWLKSIVDIHVGDADINDPMVSVLNADFSGFPPTIIQAAGRDICLSDAFKIQRKLRDNGSEVAMDIWEGLWHDFEIFHTLPETDKAINILIDFIRD